MLSTIFKNKDEHNIIEIVIMVLGKDYLLKSAINIINNLGIVSASSHVSAFDSRIVLKLDWDIIQILLFAL